MGLLPKSRRARRRLTVVALAAPILVLATGLSLYAMGDAAVFFYSPSQAVTKKVPPGRLVRLGGMVEAGSLEKLPDGEVRFGVTDYAKRAEVVYRGDLPDLFREGQGVVTQGVFRPDGVFEAREVLAKHDEKYMPREVAESLKKSGEWRSDAAGGTPTAPSSAGMR